MKTNYIFILLCAFLFNCENNKKSTENYEETVSVTKADTSIEHGKYLVTLMDCNTCHTPKVMTEQGPKFDMSRMLSGYPENRPLPQFDSEVTKQGVLFPHPDLTATMGPWGISFTGNLTPDDTGMGTWSLEQFKIAMTQGKFKGLEGSRMLLPPMPWESYASLTDADLEAIFNYLKSIPAIENAVPGPLAPE
ncbi:diheme cytochrome c-553 [Winogradskyella maritima]|uniref:Diheme cytochrome c-553 n=1 Tax=Winogradskyella maritima TaxID=1517766 RepID=A0ABV8AK70_9FLAO|nr:diheme cytochrome c-553 [Winogradskyella maritima]